MGTNNYHEIAIGLRRIAGGALEFKADEQLVREAAHLLELIAQPAAPVAVPDDWRLVPVEPSDEMLECDSIKCHCGHQFSSELFRHAWSSMIAAAPTPPAQQQNQPQNIPEIIPAVAPVAVPDGEAIREAIREALGDAYDCTRVWSAWGYGTMSQNDFESVAGNDERVDEIACAVEQVISAAPTPPAGPRESPCTPPAQQPVAVPDGYRLLPVKITRPMIEAALYAHYGKRRVRQVGGAVGVDMTANGINYSGLQALRRMWAGALAAAPTPPAFQRVSILKDVPVCYSSNAGSTAVNPSTLLPGTHAPTPPAQLPVAWRVDNCSEFAGYLEDAERAAWWRRRGETVVPLYAAPPAQQGQPTDGFLLVTPEQLARHTLTAGECPSTSKIILVSHLKRLHNENTANLPAAPGDTASPAPEQADSTDELREEIGGLKSVNTMLVQALKRLTFHARTTGGTAGPDAGLMEACEQAEHALSFGGFGRAYMEGADAAPAQQGQWVPVSERLPEVPEGDEQELIVCVRRSRNGESYVFSARYLNKYSLYSKGHPDADEDGFFEATGWHDVKEHREYDGWYSPLIDANSGDEVTHWMPLPTAPGDTAPPAPEQAEHCERDLNMAADQDAVKVPRELLERVAATLEDCAVAWDESVGDGRTLDQMRKDDDITLALPGDLRALLEGGK